MPMVRALACCRQRLPSHSCLRRAAGPVLRVRQKLIEFDEPVECYGSADHQLDRGCKVCALLLLSLDLPSYVFFFTEQLLSHVV